MNGELWGFALFGGLALAGALFTVTAKRTFHAAMGLGAVLVAVGGLFVIMGSPFLGVVQILVYVGGILTLLVFAVMFVAGDESEAEFAEPKREGTPGWVIWGSLLIGGLIGLGIYWSALPVTAAIEGAVAGQFLAFLIDLVVALLFAGIIAVIVLGIALAFQRGTASVRVGMVVAPLLFVAVSAILVDVPGWDAQSPGGAAGADSMPALVKALFSTHVIALEVLGVLLTAAMIGALVIARPFRNPSDDTRYVAVPEDLLTTSIRIADVDAPTPAPLRPTTIKEDEP